MASLEFKKKIDWKGYFVGLEKMTFKEEVKLAGLEGKEPIKDYESGGILFQGKITFDKKLEIEKVKVMMENIEKVKDEMKITGEAIGVIKNCEDIKSLECTEKTELRLLRVKIKEEELKIDKGLGELIEVEVEKKATITKSGFIIRDCKFKDELSIEDSYIEGSQLEAEKEMSVEKSFLFGSSLKTSDKTTIKESNLFVSDVKIEKELDMTDTNLFGSKIEISQDLKLSDSNLIGSDIKTDQTLDLKDSNVLGLKVESSQVKADESVVDISTLKAGSVSLTSSSAIIHKYADGGTDVDESSSYLGLKSDGNVSSSGSVLLTSSSSEVTINNKGFIGIGVSGTSNLSSLKEGVDILAIPRINNRTKDDFIVEAKKSILMGASKDFLADAGSDACMVAGNNLLCEAGSTMNLCASGDQLVKGSTVYCVGDCKFTPRDHCIPPCNKPVWKSGSTQKSVTPPSVPG